MLNVNLIFWPMIALALATIMIYLPMVRVRIHSVRSGQVKAHVYKHNHGEPEESRRYSNAIGNQFESPVLFYVVCLAAYVSDNISWLFFGLAVAYAGLKITHLIIHTTINKLKYRLRFFALSIIVLIGLWLVFAIELVI